MPDIKKLSVEQVEGGRIVTVSAFLPNKQDLEQDDLVEIERIAFEAGTVGVKAADEKPAETGRRRRGAEPAEEASAGEAQSGRRRRGAASAEAEATSPATDQAPAEGRRRRGAASAETSDATSATIGTGEGRRRRGASDDKPKISDGDLTKAGAAALAKLIEEGENKSNATKFILDILGEFKDKAGDPVENVADLQGDDRQKFLDELKKENLI